MYDEIAGTLKVFGVVWLIAFIALYCVLGFSKWAFWGAIGLGCIVSIIVTFILGLITGATTISFPSKDNDNDDN